MTTPAVTATQKGLMGSTTGSSPHIRIMSQPPQAENDIQYESYVVQRANLSYLTSAAYTRIEISCKPLCESRAPLLDYPNHPEFQRRISTEHWDLLHDDMFKELYNQSPFCGALQPLMCLFGCDHSDSTRSAQLNALYRTIAYYNDYLFHPMLIDAQVFSAGQGTGRYLIGFLIASSSDEYISFKRPVPGKSRGYLNPSVRREMNFGLNTNYSVPHSVPHSAPRPRSMHDRSQRPAAEIDRDMVRVPASTESTRTESPLPPELQASAKVQVVQSQLYVVASAGAYATSDDSPVLYAAPQSQQPQMQPYSSAAVVYPAVAAPSGQSMARPVQAVAVDSKI